MKFIVIGAGPTGLFLGISLARRGHRVTVVDRDSGPGPDGTWTRRGVMQFEHAHAFRPQVTDALLAEMPDAYDSWLAAGAQPVSLEHPQAGSVRMGTRSRRVIFERALRDTALGQQGLELRVGHVDSVHDASGRAGGVVVDGVLLTADVVIDASGRSGRVTRGLGPRRGVGGSCGLAYVDRMYQLRPGAEPGPLTNPLAWQADFDGYQVLLFLHERGMFSVVFLRPAADRQLHLLREQAAFEAACEAIPGLATWTDPTHAYAVTPVLPGGNMLNHYRGQTTDHGDLVLPGLFFVGDAVCTTTPTFGRGMATSLLQARELLRLIDLHRDDTVTAGLAFDAWCEQEMRPWVEDHLRLDEAQRRRWLGDDIDLDAKLPSDLIMRAAEVDPTIQGPAWTYLSMTGAASCLDVAEERARTVYRSGWRPAFSPGPSRDELVDLIHSTLSVAA
ncbi:MAG: FAD-dependent oxidoreductase [Propionibacteriaceae bacterium]